MFKAGVIDEDYRGEVRVILFNHSDEPFIIQAGDRIAQLICERICYPKLQEVEVLFVVYSPFIMLTLKVEIQ